MLTQLQLGEIVTVVGTGGWGEIDASCLCEKHLGCRRGICDLSPLSPQHSSEDRSSRQQPAREETPVSSAVLGFGIPPGTKSTGTAFPGTLLCPQSSLWGKSQGCQSSVS